MDLYAQHRMFGAQQFTLRLVEYSQGKNGKEGLQRSQRIEIRCPPPGDPATTHKLAAVVNPLMDGPSLIMLLPPGILCR